jgi:DNA-binding NtrC family response regulator
VKQEILALVVHSEDASSAVKAALESESIEIHDVRTCKEVADWLQGGNPPHLVFTDTTLSDGTWADVVALAARAHDPVDVIVVSRQMDQKLYIEAIERGAYDFITPPFAVSDLEHVVRCAAWNVCGRRESLARAA